MDLSFVTELSAPRSRDDLPAPEPGTAFLAGGTWLYSEPQPTVTRLVDLTTLDWPAITVHDNGIELAATCTIEHLCNAPLPAEWTAAPLFRPCAESLLASWKIWHTATVGGNLALAFPAGAMISLCCALDAELLIWTADGGERRVPVDRFVTGAGRHGARQPATCSAHPPARHRAAGPHVATARSRYSPLGRSGVVIGRPGRRGRFRAVRHRVAPSARTCSASPAVPGPDVLSESLSRTDLPPTTT